VNYDPAEILAACAEAGGNFIDTANMYTGGESERIVGACVADNRDRFVICTKYAIARIAESVDAISRRLDASPAQVALAWLIARGAIPIVGATSAVQIRENMAAVDLVLDDAPISELDGASSFDAGHPYNMLSWDMSMSLGFGGMFDQIDVPNFPRPIK
jgi:aryl-alcohol dehydrogenase-like predicted oxidoreductase